MEYYSAYEHGFLHGGLFAIVVYTLALIVLKNNSMV